MSAVVVDNSRSILIADSDGKFLDAVKLDPKATELPPLVVKNSKDVQTIMADRTHRLVALVFDPKIDPPKGIDVLRYSRIHRPTIPIYMIHEGAVPFTEQEQKELGFQEILPKPITYSQIVDRIGPNVMNFDVGSKTLEKKVEQTLVGQEFSADDASFIPIWAEDFLAGTKSCFDVYVRLASGKYIKILSFNESFEPNRLLNYLKKGVREFYLERAAQAQYVSYCDKIAQNINKNYKFSSELKAKGTLTHGEETANFLRTQGINTGTVEYAKGFVSNVESFARTTKLAKDQSAIKFFDDFSKYDHGVSVTMVASLIGRSLKFDGERGIKLLGLASLFHDVGLIGFPEAFQEEDESKLSEAQLKDFRKHPLIGSQALAQLDMDPVIVQAVAQHHERRNRKGFPSQLGVGSINKIAEIIGISDDFIKLMKLSKSKPHFSIFDEMKSIFDGFSLDVTESFVGLFFPNERR